MRPFTNVVKTCVLLAGFAGVVAAPIPAAGANEAPARGGAGYVMIGGSLLDLDGLNAALRRGGYSRFHGSFLTAGIGGHAFIGSLILGVEGQMLMERRGANVGSKTALSGGCGFFDIGYVAYSESGFMIYPLLGIGAGAINMKIMGREAASFEEILVDTGRSVRLQTSGFLMHFALGADQWLGSVRRNGRRGFFIGIRAGYAFAPVKSGWELGGTEIEGGPKVGWTGPYVRVSIGVGSRIP